MLIPVLILIASSTSTSEIIAHAASMFGNLGTGYDAGRAAADNPFSTGYYDASCPSDFSSNVAYCSAYQIETSNVNIKGNNNNVMITQNQDQNQNSPNNSNSYPDNSNNGGSSSTLPNCKALCVG